MSRPVDIRAWDGVKMHVVGSLILFVDGSFLVNDEIPVKEGRLMFSTGLRDKRGVRIFEGDIVRTRETAISRTLAQKMTRGADVVQLEETGVITWDEEGCDYNLVGADSRSVMGFPRLDASYEVIGNVYENSDLLK